MKRAVFLVVVAVLGARGAAGASTPRSAPATIHGIVAGAGYYENARVCSDGNGNGRCDPWERATRSGSDGRFTLPGGGPVVAEIGPGTMLHDPDTGVASAVARTLTFQAPEQARAVVSPISTELAAMMDARHDRSREQFQRALASLARRLGLTPDEVLADPNLPGDPVKTTLRRENDGLLDRIAAAVDEAGKTGPLIRSLRNRLALDDVQTLVVIYAENRSFNNLFGLFPGANGINKARRSPVRQKDRDGSVLAVLPPVWTGLTASGQSVSVTQAQTTNILPNAPFQIDDPRGSYFPTVPTSVVTRDLYHRFFENQMQINGGRNDGFVAWANSGGLVMGYYDGRQTALWGLAQQYTLADNFFMGAFGGSFLNHQYLICACAPVYPNADTAPPHPTLTTLDLDDGGHYLPRLTLSSSSPDSALDGPPVYALSGAIAPENYFNDGTFHAVNTMTPPYQPSANAPAVSDATHLYADPGVSNTMPPQTAAHIGTLLTAKGLSWVWYAGAWDQAVEATTSVPYSQPPSGGGSNPPPVAPTFQFHHQPFNYYAGFDPVAHAAERLQHMKDYTDLVDAAAAGTLPPVTFYKPQGNLNQHGGYASVDDGDAHIAAVIQTLENSPQWSSMLIVVTYDENGGWWDHVTPPRGDLLGPGSRVPALIVSPFAKHGFVDHTQYDTGSILRFLTHRYSLPVLAGLTQRDDALAANGEPPMGDFTNALDFP